MQCKARKKPAKTEALLATALAAVGCRPELFRLFHGYSLTTRPARGGPLLNCLPGRPAQARPPSHRPPQWHSPTTRLLACLNRFKISVPPCTSDY